MKTKAIVQILILVFATLSISLVAPSVEAQEKVCCERTTDGEYCLYTDRANCDPNAKIAGATCEQTSYCKIGCCFDSEEGLCAKNTPRSLCEAQINNTWKDSPSCEITQCQEGCCVLGTECNFVTQVRCKKETSRFPYVEMTFDESILSESECIDKCRSLEKGACVMEDGTCLFTTREECSSEASSSAVTSANASLVGFHKDMLCSNDALGTDCARQQTTGCLEGEEGVYWYDSCGNPENIYSSDREASYNNGFVLSPAASCQLTGPLDPNCGNCDYEFGSLCLPVEYFDYDIQMTDGDYTCADLSCPKTYESAGPNAGTSKKNGESWCIYDGVVGFGRDLVGSRHYRHLCIAGKEMVESCEDYREELCVQGILGQGPLPNTQAFGATGEYIEARCRDNRYEDCVDCNTIEECSYEECQGISSKVNKQLCCARVCCEKEDVRDCYWLGAEEGEHDRGRCVPQVPPGIAHWDYAASTSEISEEVDETPESSDICSRADEECKVTWKQGGISRIFNQDDYDCVENCHCTKKEWVIAGNNFCRSLGDCGAHYNIAGQTNLDGYSNTASDEDDFFDGHRLTAADLGDWASYLAPTGKFKEPGFFDEFFDKETNWLPFAGLILMGGYSWLTKDGFGTGLIAGPSATVNAISSFGQRIRDARLKRKDPNYKPAQDYKVTAGDVFTTADFASKFSIDTNQLKSDYVATLIPQDIIDYDTTYSAELEADPNYNQLLGAFQTASAGPDQESAFENLQGYVVNHMAESALPGLMVGSLGDYSSAFSVASDGTITATRTGKIRIDKLPFGKRALNWVNMGLWIWGAYNLVDIFFTEYESETYTVSCLPWQAPSGGNDCEFCNNPMKPCSEYRCKSLGQNCALLNEDDPGNITCYNQAPNDATSPLISIWPEAIDESYTYAEITDEGNKGYKLNEDVPAFTPVTLGIQTNEPAQCKYAVKPLIEFEDMPDYFGDHLYKYEHGIIFTLPSELSEEKVLELTNGGVFTIYIRCQDGSGNVNNRDYFIKFKTDPSPDLTPPVIELTSVQNGAFLAFNTTALDFSAYVNEPADCKWDLEDAEYDLMQYTLTCDQKPFTGYSFYSGLYECTTKLQDLPTTQETINLYFRCKDQPTAEEENRNVNTDSYVLTLKTTDQLKIVGSAPVGTLFITDPTMRVITSGGAENGFATCSYSENDINFESMIQFLITGNTSIHEQPFTDLFGDYFYNIKCRDIGGNENSTTLEFNVDTDEQPPIIISIEEDDFAEILIIQTNEPSTCEYSSKSFLYGEGTVMTGTNTILHEATLEEDENRYYVKCVDEFENRMSSVIYL